MSFETNQRCITSSCRVTKKRGVNIQSPVRFSVGSLLALLIAFSGCSEKQTETAAHKIQLSHQTGQIRSMQDLRIFLVPGTTTNALVEKFGQPYYTDIVRSGIEMRFEIPPVPAEGQWSGSHVVGVVVLITNGCVSKWGCSYRDLSPEPNPTSSELLFSAKESSNHISLRCFVVKSQQIPQGRFVDTDRFPKLGYIPNQPDLTITNVSSVKLDQYDIVGTEGRSSTSWSFRFTFESSDTPRLEALTDKNIAERLLIMIGDEPVIAPVIVTPIANGLFEIKCKDRAMMEFVKKQLAKPIGATK